MSTRTFEAALLPDEQKEKLCRELLAEFGTSVRRKTGEGELICSCPLPNTRHKNGDKNPSASLNYKKLTFNCLGCGSSGGLLWFIAICRGEDAPESHAWLASQTGIGQSSMDLSALMELITAIYHPTRSVASPIPHFDPTVLDPWTWGGHHPYMTTGEPELGVVGRGCREETLDHFRVGYAPEYFMGRHQPPQERIIIPLFWRDALVGWQARALARGDEPKYKNSPELPRDRVLYNHERRRELVLVESPLSVLRHWHHVPTMQATFGAQVTEAQLRLCQRYSKITLWFDNDDAGWAATSKVGEALNRYAPVSVVESPYAADPADMDDETVVSLLAAPVPYGVWAPPTTLTPWRK